MTDHVCEYSGITFPTKDIEKAIDSQLSQSRGNFNIELDALLARVGYLEEKTKMLDEWHRGLANATNTRIIELETSQREQLNMRIEMAKNVRDQLHRLDQSRQASSQANIDLFERVTKFEKRISNLESEVKCNITGITYNSERIESLELCNAAVDDGLVENGQAIDKVACEGDEMRERITTLESYMHKHDERIVKLEQANQQCFDANPLQMINDTFADYLRMHKDHYHNHEQLKIEFQLIVNAQDAQCVQIDKLEQSKSSHVQDAIGYFSGVHPSVTCEYINPDVELATKLGSQSDKLMEMALSEPFNTMIREAYCQPKTTDMTFMAALAAMKNGKMMKRKEWHKFAIGMGFEENVSWDDVMATDWMIVS